jgi:hypothetical protein
MDQNIHHINLQQQQLQQQQQQRIQLQHHQNQQQQHQSHQLQQHHSHLQQNNQMISSQNPSTSKKSDMSKMSTQQQIDQNFQYNNHLILNEQVNQFNPSGSNYQIGHQMNTPVHIINPVVFKNENQFDNEDDDDDDDDDDEDEEDEEDEDEEEEEDNDDDKPSKGKFLILNNKTKNIIIEFSFSLSDLSKSSNKRINKQKSFKKDNKQSKPVKGRKTKKDKKTRGRVRIDMEFIDNKIRRYTTFSKRKAGIMKKAYELSILTGTQVLLLVASETGHVYTFATNKLQPIITSEAGKTLIQLCLSSDDQNPNKDINNESTSQEPEKSDTINEAQSNIVASKETTKLTPTTKSKRKLPPKSVDHQKEPPKLNTDTSSGSSKKQAGDHLYRSEFYIKMKK